MPFFSYHRIELMCPILSIFPQSLDGNRDNLSLHQKPFPLTPQTPLSWARNHFGCKDLKALFLEDEGDEGTADMHWEQTLFAVS